MKYRYIILGTVISFVILGSGGYWWYLKSRTSIKSNITQINEKGVISQKKSLRAKKRKLQEEKQNPVKNFSSALNKMTNESPKNSFSKDKQRLKILSRRQKRVKDIQMRRQIEREIERIKRLRKWEETRKRIEYLKHIQTMNHP